MLRFRSIAPVGLSVLFAGAPAGVGYADEPPVLLFSWGEFGAGPGQFNHPHAIAVDPAGSVYVADTDNHRIQKFDAQGNFLLQWGTPGLTAPGEFRWPHGIAADPSGWIYVTDWANHRIQKFDAAGNFLTAWGSFGSDPGEFFQPSAIAVGPDGSVYTCEDYNHRVQKFTSNGGFLLEWGSIGFGAGQFQGPRGITVAADGLVYVCDTYNFRVQVFDSSGNFMRMWGAGGRPSGIDGDGNGDLYVANRDLYRVEKFDPNGTSLTTWMTGVPMDVAVDAADDIYVVDFYHQVQKFGSPGTGVEQPSQPSVLAWSASVNPARGVAVLSLAVPRATQVAVDVFDARGRWIREAYAGLLPAGANAITWDGLDWRQCSVPSGVYYALARAGAARAVHDIVLLR